MGISTFMGLETTLRGLLAQQRALDVTSHNISNASTPGYSRQEAVLATSEALPIAGFNGGLLGTGVDVTSYRRIRDDFLDLQYRGQSMSLGEQSTRSTALEQVELGLAEPGDNGIAARLNEFWSAWGSLSNASTNPAARQAVIDKGRALADAINQLQGGLQSARTQAYQEYTSLTGPNGQVQGLATDLSLTLNKIRDAELTGAQPNDLYDRRDQLLDQLSSLGQVTMVQNPAPTATALVNGKPIYSFSVTLGAVTLVSSDANGKATPAGWVPASPFTSGAFPLAFNTSDFPSGKLRALLDLQSAGGQIAGYQSTLGAVATALTTSVNGLYNATTGTDFFAYATNATTGLPELKVNVAGVAATGDNTLALKISALRNDPSSGGSTYTQLVTQIGNDVASAGRQEATAQVLSDNLKDRRESIAGVSLDEEMTNLIRFQRAYQASARTMSTTDDLLDTLINRTGRVGL